MLYSATRKSRSTAGQLKPHSRCLLLIDSSRQPVRSNPLTKHLLNTLERRLYTFRVNIAPNKIALHTRSDHSSCATANKWIANSLPWPSKPLDNIGHATLGLSPMMMFLVVIVHIALAHITNPFI